MPSQTQNYNGFFTRTKQDRVTLIYGWTAVAIVIVTVLYVFSRTFVELLKSLFTGVYQVSSKLFFSRVVFTTIASYQRTTDYLVTLAVA